MSELFTDGLQGSRSAFWQALESLQHTGQTVLDDLETARQTTLLAFEQGLSALNGRRQRVNRLLTVDMAGRFVVSDLLDIDQQQSSATVRADSQAVTLKQRKNAPPAVIQSQTFTASSGTVQAFGNLYQVYVPSGALPTGTFQITFRDPIDVSLLVFDLVFAPSNPAVTVRVSSDSVYYTDALQVARNGARVSAYLPAGIIRYLQIAITPSMPDNIGGYTYTFGLEGFYPYLVAFHLESQFASKPVTIFPQSASLQVNFTQDPGVKAFLSLDGVSFTPVTPGMALAVPGVTRVNGPQTATVDSNGLLHWKDQTNTTITSLPATVYPRSLRILDPQGNPVVVAAGLNPANAGSLTKPAICWYNNQLTYRPAGTNNNLYSVSYTFGPSSLSAYLRVQLVSRDRSQTPIFSGMTLSNVY